MTITFNHPHVPASSNPFIDFNPRNINHYPTGPGVYIVGVKRKFEGNEVFCPLYVGQTADLQSRLFIDHRRYCDRITQGGFNSIQEIFNLRSPLRDVYADIKVWNYFWDKRWPGKTQKQLLKIPFFEQVSQSRKIDSNYIYVGGKKVEISFPQRDGTLIWFNAPEFFDYYFNVVNVSRYEYDMKGHCASIVKDLPENFPASLALIDDIRATKSIMFEDFYFIYAQLEGDLSVLKAAENAAKSCLERLNIYTYSSGDAPLIGTLVDISPIQDRLINLGGHPFGFPYNNPLIVNV